MSSENYKNVITVIEDPMCKEESCYLFTENDETAEEIMRRIEDFFPKLNFSVYHKRKSKKKLDIVKQ